MKSMSVELQARFHHLVAIVASLNPNNVPPAWVMEEARMLLNLAEIEYEAQS